MPALPGFRKYRLSESPATDELTRVFGAAMQALEDVLRPLTNNPRASSVVQSNVAVLATATVINHKLALGAGKNPNGWLITDIDTNATVKRAAWDASTITLVASSPCVIQLEVW